MITSPLKAIRTYCINCSNDQANEVRDCPCTTCPLYDFRFGKNPYHTRNISDEQREAMSQRMKELNKKSQNAF